MPCMNIGADRILLLFYTSSTAALSSSLSFYVYYGKHGNPRQVTKYPTCHLKFLFAFNISFSVLLLLFERIDIDKMANGVNWNDNLIKILAIKSHD